jgi:hypothetical protein
MAWSDFRDMVLLISNDNVPNYLGGYDLIYGGADLMLDLTWVTSLSELVLCD